MSLMVPEAADGVPTPAPPPCSGLPVAAMVLLPVAAAVPASPGLVVPSAVWRDWSQLARRAAPAAMAAKVHRRLDVMVILLGGHTPRAEWSPELPRSDLVPGVQIATIAEAISY